MSRKIVLLIQPPQLLRKGARFQSTFPLGLAYVAGYLERYVPEVECLALDAVAEGFPNSYDLTERHMVIGLSDADIKARIADIKPTIVGISCLFTNQQATALQVARLAKDVDPAIVTVMGGAHATAAADQLLGHNEVDLIVRGPGEECFADVVRAILEGGGVKHIPGVAYRERETGRIVVPPPAVTSRPIEELPFPAYHKIPVHKYFAMAEHSPIHPSCPPAMPILTARGCPYHCTFCYVSYSWGTNINHRSLDNVLREVRMLRDTYGVRELHVMDDNFGFYRDFSCDFLAQSRTLGIEKIVPFSGATMKALKDPVFMEALRDAGLHYLSIFVESGSPETLRKVRKPHNIAMVDQVIRQARERDFLIYGFFVLGFPWQSIADMEHEVDLAGELDLDFRSFSVLCALPGTALYNECRDNGHLAPGVSFEDISLYSGNIATERFSNLDVERIAKTAYLRTNFATPGHVERAAKVFSVSVAEMLSRKERAELFLAGLGTTPAFAR
jgi:anaerobic magnesium-protoporphyrin IX monomethyl ester cyclase